MSNTLEYIWSTIPTSCICLVNKEGAQKEFFCVASRVCDESRIPFTDLPTAAAGPRSNNWPSEPRSKVSTLASFRHLRLLLLLVFGGNLHQAEQASDISGLDALPVVNEGDEMPDAAQLLCSSA